MGPIPTPMVAQLRQLRVLDFQHQRMLMDCICQIQATHMLRMASRHILSLLISSSFLKNVFLFLFSTHSKEENVK